jgi:hypothetical protein
MSKKNNDNEQGYDKAETERRLDAALRDAVVTPPKPMKEIPRKRPTQKAEA